MIEERSSNGNPLVQVTFADGSSDFLILSQYENLDHHFIGYLEKEPAACVAMVNHHEHRELTIMSNRMIGSTQYKWKHNGDVELIPEVFSDGKETDAVMSSSQLRKNQDHDVIYLEHMMHQNIEIEEHITPKEEATVPTKNKLQVQVTTVQVQYS